MTQCKALRDDLADVALGVPASDELRLHLQDCPACSAALERHTALAQRMDAAVHALVRERPPAQLFPSTIAAVRNTGRRRGWTPVWPRAAIGAALAAIVLFVAIGLRATQPPAAVGPELSRLTAWHSPTDTLLDVRGSVLAAPLRDRWFDLKPSTSRSQRTSRGEVHGA